MANQLRERLLLQRYIEYRYPQHHVKIGCPLGTVPESLIIEYGRTAALRVARKMRPEVDALVFDGKTLILVEAKIARWVDGLAKLPLYKAMLPDTPELEQYRSWPVKMRLVIPFTQANMELTAQRVGVELEQFSTPEIDEYLTNTLPFYHTAEYKRRRAQVLDTRTALGVE